MLMPWFNIKPLLSDGFGLKVPLGIKPWDYDKLFNSVRSQYILQISK